MEHLGTLNSFVQSAELGSFAQAGHNLGVSSSAIGKAIARLEKHLGVRLFHRNTRSMTLTEEGQLFLTRCRRIFEELELAELELSQKMSEPAGRLRVSLPMVGMLMMPVLSEFMLLHPKINLDLDFTDRTVDVIEEGFDIVIRAGNAVDSGMMRRHLGYFKARIVASPEYLKKNGIPKKIADLSKHDCLIQRSTSTGKPFAWHLKSKVGGRPALRETMSANTIEPLVYLAEKGFGIACLPPFAVADQIKRGQLISLLEKCVEAKGEFAALWPTSRQLSPKVRVLVDYLANHLKLDQTIIEKK